MSNLKLKVFAPGDFLTLKEASEWAATSWKKGYQLKHILSY